MGSCVRKMEHCCLLEIKSCEFDAPEAYQSLQKGALGLLVAVFIVDLELLVPFADL
jgi:hypothetical protein